MIHVTGWLGVYEVRGQQEQGRVTLWPWGQTEERTVMTRHSHFYCLLHLNLCCHPSPSSPSSSFSPFSFFLFFWRNATWCVYFYFFLTCFTRSFLWMMFFQPSRSRKQTFLTPVLKTKAEECFLGHGNALEESWDFTSGPQWDSRSVVTSEVMIIFNFVYFCEDVYPLLQYFYHRLPRNCLSIKQCQHYLDLDSLLISCRWRSLVCLFHQRCKVAKFIYSSTIFLHNFEALVLLSTCICCYFILTLIW